MKIAIIAPPWEKLPTNELFTPVVLEYPECIPIKEL